MNIIIVLLYALTIAGCFEDHKETFIFRRDGTPVTCKIEEKRECGFSLYECSDKRKYQCVKTLELIEMPQVGHID